MIHTAQLLAYNSHVGGVSATKAAQDAVTHVLDRNFTIVNAGRIRGMVPKEEKINPDLIALGADVWLAQTFRNPETTPYQMNLAQFDKYLPEGMRPEDMNATAARILNADGRLVLTHDVKAAELTAPAAAIPNGVFAANEDGKLSIISVPVSVLEAMGREELELRKRVPVGGMGAEAFGGRSWADEQNEELDLEQMRDTTVDAERF